MYECLSVADFCQCLLALNSKIYGLAELGADVQQVDSCMGPALKAAFMVQSHIGGKMLLFQAAVPSIGPGKIKNRESAALYGTDREHTLRCKFFNCTFVLFPIFHT